MGRLSDDLRNMGFTTTGEESPINEEGTLWSKGHELVCDETGTVIDGDHHVDENEEQERNNGRLVFRYRNSERVKMFGGYTSTYFD